VGGFPEPFLENDPVFYARWKKSHIDVMLRSRVGSSISYVNLAQDLKKDPKTVKSYLKLLENAVACIFKKQLHCHELRT